MTATSRGRIFVLDDDQTVVDYLVEMLVEHGFEAVGDTRVADSLEQVATGAFDLVVSDVEMPEQRGLDFMSALHERRPEQLVVLMTAFGSIDLAVEAMRQGASDFVTKPFAIEELLAAIQRVLRDRRMRREIVRLRAEKSEDPRGTLVAASPAMRRLLDIARRASRTSSTVLLTGESGTGKGAVARFIHDESPRRSGPFVHVNCGALPHHLIESELFGVRRGAFTDARESRAGLFVEAAGGTLFLDEIGELPLEAQPKLLQVLETGRVRAIGAASETAVDVRVLAATNRSLHADVREKRFRADLFFRLNVIRADLPPLRERVEDIEPLVDRLLHRCSERLGRPVSGVTAEAMRWLRSYSWPGNVRELANTLERAVALSEHDTLVLEDLAHAFGDADPSDFLATAAARGRTLEHVERDYIRLVLEANEGNKSRAARVLGIDRRTLYRKLFGEAESEDPA